MKGDFTYMAKNKQIHTVPRPGGWGNKSSGASRIAKLYPNKAAAQAAGRKTAINQNTYLVYSIYHVDSFLARLVQPSLQASLFYSGVISG